MFQHEFGLVKEMLLFEAVSSELSLNNLGFIIDGFEIMVEFTFAKSLCWFLLNFLTKSPLLYFLFWILLFDTTSEEDEQDKIKRQVNMSK